MLAPSRQNPENPSWHAAAQSLVNALSASKSSDDRLDLLELVCEQLQPQLYPAFLQILSTIEVSASLRAKQLVATTLVDALLSGRLPSGESSAWGASINTDNRGSGRKLGPLEYLCAAHSQGQAKELLSAAQFEDLLVSLIKLVNTDAQAASLYAQRLSQEASDVISGSYAADTRKGLLAMATAWADKQPEKLVVDQFLKNSQKTGLLHKAMSKSVQDFIQ